MKRLTRYPSYNVMNEQHEWDEHTRKIVNSRLQTFGGHTFLTTVEAEMLRAWCSLLMDDARPEIIQFVLGHIDRSLASGEESQRKPGIPPVQELVRQGLQALEAACQSIHTKLFFHLEEKQKKQLMEEVSQGEAVPHEVWRDVPQQVFFQKLLSLSIEAYYSHPEIWSEIGFGGPAYPRGYARMEHLDPWEAKEEKKKE
ncbi:MULTISPECIES: gluconate 2-dehydrogenase subunit 3 family protein [Paenibacillus]|uniref:Subunit 3 of gluconate 2-dehydrogenase n=1 Tax=Paenibacillus naphthalenovorans TaxID=162209 RepID=A0A0U2WA89_9BACL|nr:MULTISPECIES: gluconate 2-dehydrogenase subunit 3 family protein [Paenibacillus]ALS24405.1 subunit 3 of gluconate 2-dehydrogenase [Paenibacillus naphthalenovorans]GCL74694.1 hypothetical protein PN4B1_46730 [Paenibacillus naphthalenovorans]